MHSSFPGSLPNPMGLHYKAEKSTLYFRRCCMSAEDNKKFVLNFFENFSAGKAEAALGQMSDTATWTVMGKPAGFALAGTKTKAQFVELLKGIGAAMPKGLRLTPKALTAEGDRVAVEAES